MKNVVIITIIINILLFNKIIYYLIKKIKILLPSIIM